MLGRGEGRREVGGEGTGRRQSGRRANLCAPLGESDASFSPSLICVSLLRPSSTRYLSAQQGLNFLVQHPCSSVRGHKDHSPSVCSCHILLLVSGNVFWEVESRGTQSPVTA